MKKFLKKDIVYYGGLALALVIAIVAILYQQQIQEQSSIYFPRPLTTDDLQKYSNTDPKAVIIYPIFTQNAYKKDGFYDFYNSTCKTCDVVSLNPEIINASYVTGINAMNYLMQLHYPFITDIMVDKHPEILQEYDKIILLHNEYVTKKEFDAITSHPNVIYLYPNSLYTEISADYDKMQISLVKGHGFDLSKTPNYPIKNGIASGNGFGYVTSSKHEYDINCKNYKWEARPNGIQPTCWPAFLIQSDRSVLQVIKDYPEKTPNLISSETKVNMSSLPTCDPYGNCK